MKTDNTNREKYSGTKPRACIDGVSSGRRIGRQIVYNSRVASQIDGRHDQLRCVNKNSPDKKVKNKPVAIDNNNHTDSLNEIEVDKYIAPTDCLLSTYEYAPKHKLVIRKIDWTKFLSRFAAGAFAVVFIISCIVAWNGYRTAKKVLSGTTLVASLSSKEVAPELLVSEGSGRVNILILGVGGGAHAGADLTDTIIVASLDPVNKAVTMLSLPRDLWVKMPTNFLGDHQKINAAYSAGKYKYLGKVNAKNNDKEAVKAGLVSADAVVSEVLGINIDYHVLVNFEAFKHMVDAVGGISIDVKETLVDQSMAWENGNSPVLAKSGLQTMFGKQALLYARSRHTSSDFARSERQRQLILALKAKIMTLDTMSNPTKLQGLLDALGGDVYTDLSINAVTKMYELMKDTDDTKITSIDLVSGDHKLVTTDRVGNISVVRPKLGYDNYSAIQSFVGSQTRDGYLLKENANIVVVAPSEAGANSEKDRLTGLGYNVQQVLASNSLGLNKMAVIDLSGGNCPYTLNYLEKRFGTKPSDKLPQGLVAPETAQFVIILSE